MYTQSNKPRGIKRVDDPRARNPIFRVLRSGVNFEQVGDEYSERLQDRNHHSQ
jgi:transposase